MNLEETIMLLRRSAVMADRLYELLPQSPLSTTALQLRKELEEAIRDRISELQHTPKLIDPMVLLEDLELSVRANNACRLAGLHTVGQVRARTNQELRKIKNLGARTVRELREYCGGPNT